MVDRTLVLRKLAEIDQYLLQVKEYAGISLEQYESSWKTQRIIERTLQMLIETCVDVAGHIISVMISRVSRQPLFRYWNKTMRKDRRRSQQIPPINFPLFSCFCDNVFCLTLFLSDLWSLAFADLCLPPSLARRLVTAKS